MRRKSIVERPPTHQSPLDHTEEIRYIKSQVEPIFAEMMVKIVNEEPADIIEFILSHLKEVRRKRAQGQ